MVTAFNAVQFAADPAAALAEAKRVAKPGAPVFMLVWGREERTMTKGRRNIDHKQGR